MQLAMQQMASPLVIPLLPVVTPLSVHSHGSSIHAQGKLVKSAACKATWSSWLLEENLDADLAWGLYRECCLISAHHKP